MVDQNTNQPTIPSEKAVKDQIALLSFVDEIIKERKDPDLDEKTLPKMREYLLKEVNDSINRHLISLLGDKDQIELDDLLEKKVTDEEIDTFFAGKIPNLQSEIASVLLNFRAAYLYPVRDQIEKQSTPQENPTPALTNTVESTVLSNNNSSFLPPAPVPMEKVN